VTTKSFLTIFYAVYLKDTAHSSINRNESGILCLHSARRCCFKTSHCEALWYRI